MKTVKKAMSLMLALLVIFALTTVAVFAEGDDEDEMQITALGGGEEGEVPTTGEAESESQPEAAGTEADTAADTAADTQTTTTAATTAGTSVVTTVAKYVAIAVSVAVLVVLIVVVVKTQKAQ